MSPSIPRPEHPEPQFQRASWLNLNGTWSYTLDHGKSGMDRELFKSEGFDDQITVPFCPESELSGVDHHDFIESMWYHRTLSIPSDYNGKRILLHFGAVDYDSRIYLDGTRVARHLGGSASFTVDITRYVEAGKDHNLVVHALDDTRSHRQPGGKQSPNYYSRICHYTRVTGIWQTVWLEATARAGMKSVYTTTDIVDNTVTFNPQFWETHNGLSFHADILDNGSVIASGEKSARDGSSLTVSVPDAQHWSPETPYLYDVRLQVKRGADVIDEVTSYFGIREVRCEGTKVLLNGEPVFQRLVLDQGFYKQGIWTAPSEEDLKKDIVMSMDAGFNGARLHQKVFEPRFHYWADKLGYLTWAEFPSWGCDINRPDASYNFITEWSEVVERDRNHPSIITWTPLNETRHPKDAIHHRTFHEQLYDTCKRLDPTRPVNDASGYVHAKTDVWTVHNYTQDPAKLKAELTPDPDKGVWLNFPNDEVDYTGQPYIVDEFGGIRWVEIDETRYSNQEAWGYGEDPKSLDEFYARLEGQVDALLALDHIEGYTYTQLTDIEQEQNGVYNYDRSSKFDMDRIKAIFSRIPERYMASVNA